MQKKIVNLYSCLLYDKYNLNGSNENFGQVSDAIATQEAKDMIVVYESLQVC